MEKPETAFAKSVSGCKHTLIYVFRNVAEGRFCMLSFYLSFVSSPLHSPFDGVSGRFVRYKETFANGNPACAGNMLPNMFSPCRNPFVVTPRQKKHIPKKKTRNGCLAAGSPGCTQREKGREQHACRKPLCALPAPRANRTGSKHTRSLHGARSAQAPGKQEVCRCESTT